MKVGFKNHRFWFNVSKAQENNLLFAVRSTWFLFPTRENIQTDAIFSCRRRPSTSKFSILCIFRIAETWEHLQWIMIVSFSSAVVGDDMETTNFEELCVCRVYGICFMQLVYLTRTLKTMKVLNWTNKFIALKWFSTNFRQIYRILFSAVYTTRLFEFVLLWFWFRIFFFVWKFFELKVYWKIDWWFSSSWNLFVKFFHNFTNQVKLLKSPLLTKKLWWNIAVLGNFLYSHYCVANFICVLYIDFFNFSITKTRNKQTEMWSMHLVQYHVVH